MGDFCEFFPSPKKLTALAPRGYNHLIKRQRRGFFRWQTKLESDTSAASAAPSSSLREARSRAASNAAGSRWAKSKETANAEPTRTTLPMRNVRDDGSLHQARTGRHSLLRSRDAGAAAAKAPVFRLARAISASAPANPAQARAAEPSRPRFVASCTFAGISAVRNRAAHGNSIKARLFSTKSGYAMPANPTRFETVPRMKFRSSERLSDDMVSMYGATSDGVSPTNL